MKRILTINHAQDFLRSAPGWQRLLCRYRGKQRRIFYNHEIGQFGMLYPRSRSHGHLFDWKDVEVVYAPDDGKNAGGENRLSAKYRMKAAKATFSNPFIRRCLAADVKKSPYDNKLSTGVPINGQVITVKAIEKSFPDIGAAVRRAIKGKTEYQSGRVPWRGYQMSVNVRPYKEVTDEEYGQEGDYFGFLNMEYKECCNGRYYLLINDEEFIGYDID